MSRVSPLAYVSGGLTAAATGLLALEYFLPAGFTAAVAYVLVMPLILKPRGTLFLLPFAVAIVGAANLEIEGPPHGIFSVAILLCPFIQNTRLMLYARLNRSSFLWYEPLLLLAAIGLYLYGNLALPTDWYHWVLPAPFILMATGQTIPVLLDNIKLRNFARKGYAIKIGDPAPDFELKNEEGVPVRLSDFKGRRHVLLFFYRGEWCPYCNIMLRTYAKDAARFKAKNIMLLAIGPDDPETNRTLVERMDLDFQVLSDKDLAIVRRYGIQLDDYVASNNRKRYGDDSPLPASFLVDINGIMRFTSHPERVGEYLNPALIFPVVDALKPAVQTA